MSLSHPLAQTNPARKLYLLLTEHKEFKSTFRYQFLGASKDHLIGTDLRCEIIVIYICHLKRVEGKCAMQGMCWRHIYPLLIHHSKIFLIMRHLSQIAKGRLDQTKCIGQPIVMQIFLRLIESPDLS